MVNEETVVEKLREAVAPAIQCIIEGLGSEDPEVQLKAAVTILELHSRPKDREFNDGLRRRIERLEELLAKEEECTEEVTR